MEVTYTGPRMRGAESIFQQWAITPLSSNQYWQPNDVVKFMGNISTGLVDFYRTHLEFEVEVTADMMPVGLIQVDNSAQSLINQTVLQSNQIQIERIQQYDVLAAALTDVGFSEFVCQSRSGQGIGFTNIPTNSPGVLANNRPNTATIDVPWINSGSQTPSYIVQNTNCSTFSPVLSPQYTGTGYQSNVAWMQPGSDAAYSSTVNSGLSGGSVQSFNNWLTFPFNTSWLDTYTATSGRAIGVRSEYNLAPQMCGYPDSPTSIPITAPYVRGQNWRYSTMTSQGFNPNNPYYTHYGATGPTLGGLLNAITPAPCGVSGYTKPYTPQFSRGCSEPFLSPTIPQLQMAEGKILPQPIPLNRKTFRIPLISAILGVLIPPDQFKLIPAASLKNIILQLSLNPFAFFTSGYSDVHQFDSVGMQQTNMQKRQWRILSFQWVWHLYTFSSPQLAASIDQQITRGIVISSNYWQLQAQYQLPNGSYVRNTFQIPANVQSLAEVWCLFLSNQYQTKTFCRKQFRLSNNMYSMQLKANGMYYPLQPILGNAGNPQTIDTTGDNWNFYQPLLLSNNYLFNTNIPMPRINQRNFAVNGRLYDTNNRGTYLGQPMYNPGVTTTNDAIGTLNSFATTKAVNADTAMGQAWFHQNRYVGKAIFCYSFEPYGHSKTQINGLDTRGYRQFDVTFNNSPNNVFSSDETLLIFSRSNVVVRYTENGIQVLGA